MFSKKIISFIECSYLRIEQNFSFYQQITRDELKFTKFIGRLRKKFSNLFSNILRTQLVLKGIIADEEWHDIKEHIQYDYLQDNNFSELKEAELIKERLDMLGQIENYVGTFYSKKWVQQNVLRMTDSEIESMKDEMNKEAGMDTSDGGVSVPQDTDGVTRYPSIDGSPISGDDLDAYDGAPPSDNGDN